MLSNEIRQKYLDFFKEKDHAIIPSSPLIPENDPSVLFNTAGMQPLAAYLLGEEHPMGTRLANSQKCVRTIDIDEVGDATHLTFFEMLGNWSLGDYFKEESIAMSHEFLTDKKWLGINPEYLAVTVFEGDSDAPRDEKSAEIWEQVGIPKERISYLPKSENWWAAGDTGPCGPDTEIFYWVGEGSPSKGSNVGNDEDNWMEIWNNVFMEYNRLEDGSLVKLPNENVDTGMGLERITAVLNGVKSVYETDMFIDVIKKIEEIMGDGFNRRSAYIFADHVRSSVLMISDGAVPANVDQGYVLRRLLRKSIRESYKMGYEKSILPVIGNMFIKKFEDIYGTVKQNKGKILNELRLEEEKFSKTLVTGLREFEKLLNGFQITLERSGKAITEISGKKAFTLYDTYGFPIEMTEDLARERGLTVDKKGFEDCYKVHQEKSREASKDKFKGGLADTGEMSIKYHTATHLLHEALRRILGDHVNQAGSNITAERLRFDFTHGEKMTKEQIEVVENLVNTEIAKKLDIVLEEMTIEQAKEKGAIGLFGDKYGEKVRVYTIGKNNNDYFSREICGGPHVGNTGELGRFVIKKEESSSSGVRRIKAVLM